MKSASELIQAGQRTKRDEDNMLNFSAEQKKTWAKAWAMLEASRLVTEPVTSTTSVYWMSQLIDYEPQRLLAGVSWLTNNHKGYCTLGHLRDAVASQRGEWGAFKQFEPLPHKPADKETAQKHIQEIKKLLGM